MCKRKLDGRVRAAGALYPELGSVDMPACAGAWLAIAFAASPVGPASWSGRSTPLAMIGRRAAQAKLFVRVAAPARPI
ncbi:MAG: hypothetical protein WA858_29355, partial [Xanthobacteraceae bacterium]